MERSWYFPRRRPLVSRAGGGSCTTGYWQLTRRVMRRAFLICYDIRDDKRLRRVFKVCKGYGEHWQFSIFFAILKPIDRVRLQAELEEEMNLALDQCLIIDLGENIDQARERACVLGQPLGELPQGMVVV